MTDATSEGAEADQAPTTPPASTTGTTPPFPAPAVAPAPGTATWTSATAAAAPAPADQAARPHPAQFGTIVWGMLLLGLCGFVALAQFGPGIDADRYLWAFIAVIAAGVALVAVGIVAAFRR
ncbi:hypothetical protein [Herbiconiux sp. UC225_62]|uniref:hypothetical protein n=1 Tax=Herbiconiux sp. UC225_62 TaxID=3350168 RepID=UPI0036D40DE2